MKSNNHCNSSDNNDIDNTNISHNIHIIRNKKKRRPETLIEIEQASLETNDYDPKTASSTTTLPCFESSKKQL